MTRKLNNLWEYIQYLYKKHFNIPPRIVDYMGVLDITEMCAGGLSNKSISLNLELPIDYIESVIKEYMKFPGWKDDLDISPLMVYNSFDGSYESYRSTIGTVSSVTTRDQINRSFRVCRIHNDMRREINKYVR